MIHLDPNIDSDSVTLFAAIILFLVTTILLLFHDNPQTFFHRTTICHSSRLYYAVIATRLEFGRIQRLSDHLIPHPLFQNSTIHCTLFWSNFESTDIRKCRSIHTNCPVTKPHGLTCRIAHSLDNFLKTGIPWFFRAIDDSWINPENLIEFLDQLETFVNPYRNLVFKGNIFRYFNKIKFLEGGSGFLMSRAAVEFVVSLNFTALARISLNQQEDTALTLAMFKSLNSVNDWLDFRFMGPTTGRRSAWIIPDVVRQHLSSGFREFNVTCNSEIVYPVRRAVAIHTVGEVEFERLIVAVRKVPHTLAMEWNGRTYDLCQADSDVLDRLASLEKLRNNTPIITAEDMDDRSIETLNRCGIRLRGCVYQGKSRQQKNENK